VDNSRIKLVNAVGGGDLHIELDLGELFQSIGTPVSRYDPEHQPSLYVKFDEEGATVLIFRTGKYNIAGAESINELYSTHKALTTRLLNMSLPISKANESFEVRNLVFVEDLGAELDLAELAIGLGMEYSEYEPEQFPGVHFKPPENEGVFLIFSTGKLILTGVKTEKAAKLSFFMLRERLKKMGAV